MSKLYFVVAFFLLAQIGSAQQLVFKWAKSFNPHNAINYGDYSNGRTIGVDQYGNVYSAGLFQHTVDFDPGTGLFTMASGSQYEEGIYISKLDADGNFVWARQIPALVEFGDVELKVDKNGNVYLASNFTEAIDMDPGPGVQIMTPIGGKDAFVIKLDTNGNLVWVKQFGGPGDTVPEANALEIDKDNNIIVCGMFNNTVDFDPGPGKFNLTSTAHFQAFIVKLSSNGDLIWAKQFGHSPVVYSGCHVRDVRCDLDGNIVMVGGFSGLCDFDPGTGVYNLTGMGISDGFIAKLTTDGSFVWAKSISNTGNEYNYHMISLGVDIDSKNNIISTGYFSGTFDFDPGPGVNNKSSTSRDCYVLKLNERGDLLWVKNIYGQGHDLVLDVDDNIYVTGTFHTSADLDPGPGVYPAAESYYGESVIIKLNSSGNFLSATEFPGSTLFRRMAIDPALNIYVTGFGSGPDDFDPGAGEYLLGGFSGQYPFVLKLGPCTNKTKSTLWVNACNSYSLNNETYDSSGTYSQIISNASGCDSMITLNLTINKRSTQQTKTICEPNFFFAGGANRFASGTYIDTLKSALGCDSVVTTYLTVNPKPLPDLGPDRNLCRDTSLNVTPGTFSKYLWQDGSNSSGFAISSEGMYWVSVTNDFGCTASDTLHIPRVLEGPSNFLKEVDSICNYETIKVSSLNAYSKYKWSDGSTGRETKARNPGKLSLMVTDENGCSASDTITIFAKKCIRGFSIPTAFTPNNDGRNDDFKPLLFGKVVQYRFAIYNRWGAMIFQTSDPDKAWDGRVGSSIQSTSSFAWSCHYQLEGEGPKTESGTVTLVR